MNIAQAEACLLATIVLLNGAADWKNLPYAADVVVVQTGYCHAMLNAKDGKRKKKQPSLVNLRMQKSDNTLSMDFGRAAIH